VSTTTGTTAVIPTTSTLDVPGAVLTYDVRPGSDTGAVPLLMIGSPMGAAGFTTLASYFPDRTVITYDPRGVERSVRSDPSPTSTPQQHADDISAVIDAVGAGPVDVVASSGGAVNALELVVRHPEQVRTVVAHEPPLAALLDDREEALAACHDIAETYQRDGMGRAMAKFIAIVTHPGPVPADFADQPVDPAMFGLPTEDDGSRDDALLGQNLLTCTTHEPDLDGLRTADVRLVVAAGDGSKGELAHRGSEALAARLGLPVTAFPGDHAGFLGGEYGQTGVPDEFAARLREVLAG
jgi:pimeloyl-ACP methyl ester carboxylesterase